MDAFAQLALMAKAKLVFESEDTFLSFPALSPLSYPPERLRFMKPGGEATAQDLADLSEFARIANRLPRRVLAPVEEGEYLWEIYDEVLRTGRVATGNMTPAQRAEYEHALDLLYVREPGGIRREGETLLVYRQCRDAHFVAQQEYRARQLTAESSTDEAVKRAWTDVEEPLLRRAIEQAESDWLSRGRRVEVEAAMQVEALYAAMAPSLTWQEWQDSFIEDIDMGTDPNNLRFAITGFSPYDVFDRGDWPRFTLDNAEMTRLVQDAPGELRNVFGSDLAAPDIESMSFEYRSVAVTRPWLRPAVFRSRFWRLESGAEPLSDGGSPAAGRCPAYVTALVFARNVTVRHRQQPDTATAEPPRRLLELNPHLLELHRVVQPVVPGREVRPQRIPVGPLVAGTVQFEGPARQPIAVGRVGRPAGPPLTAALASGLFDRLASNTFTASTQPTPTPAPAPQSPAATDEVAILAFICKRLGRCPDPDPTLAWA